LRVVIDTNVLISALLSQRSLPAHVIDPWRQRWFELLTSMEQLGHGLGRFG
jgi:predicted nucleic acid-binding protein